MEKLNKLKTSVIKKMNVKIQDMSEVEADIKNKN